MPVLIPTVLTLTVLDAADDAAADAPLPCAEAALHEVESAWTVVEVMPLVRRRPPDACSISLTFITCICYLFIEMGKNNSRFFWLHLLLAKTNLHSVAILSSTLSRAQANIDIELLCL